MVLKFDNISSGIEVRPVIEDDKPEDGIRFQWRTHFPLPFPFPARKCIRFIVQIDGNDFEFSIHDHLDRLHMRCVAPAGASFVVLCEKSKKVPERDMWTMKREPLKSVAQFILLREFETGIEAMDFGNKLSDQCLMVLSRYLRQCQIAAPFECGHLVFPICRYDVGTEYPSVYRIVVATREATVCATTFSSSIARGIGEPAFYMEPPSIDGGAEAIVIASYDLLAEATFAIHRGIFRTAVMNSYNAAELLANKVYQKLTQQKCDANPEGPLLSRMLERDRKHNRTQAKFLLHEGIKNVSGRSLHDDERSLYERALAVQQMRHAATHEGTVPTEESAREAYEVCCKVCRWLCSIAGIPQKPLEPDNTGAPNFSVTFG